MKKIYNVVFSALALVTLAACGGIDNSSSLSGTSSPNHIDEPSSSSPIVQNHQVILPEVDGFEVTANNMNPVEGEAVELYVTNLNPQSKRLDDVRMNGASLQGSRTNQSHTMLYRFVMPADQNAIITLEVVKVYPVTVASSLSNVLSLAGIGDGLFAEGESVTFTPTTYAGYYYRDVTSIDSDVVLQRVEDSYTFIMPAHVVTITAVTGENVYLVSYDSNDPNFSLNIENGFAARFGSNVAFQVTLNNVDLRLKEVRADGEVLSAYAANSYRFVMPAHPVSIEVAYETMYKQITVEDSNHFTATLQTSIGDSGELVDVTDTNVLSNQKIVVSVLDKEADADHGFVVDSIQVLGKNSADAEFVELSLEVIEENGAFIFFTPTDMRLLTVRLHEVIAASEFVSGTFVGFQPDNSSSENASLSITADGSIVTDVIASGKLTLVDENHYTIRYETVFYGSTAVYYYSYFVSPEENVVIEYCSQTEMFGSTMMTNKSSSTKVFVTSDLYSSNHYSIIARDPSTDGYASQFYCFTNGDGVVTTCFYDFTTDTPYWNVSLSVVSGTDGKTNGDVVEIRTQEGLTIATMRLSGSVKNVQYDAELVNN